MKRIVLIIIVISNLAVKSQISLENIYANKLTFRVTNLTQSGFKYYILDQVNKQIAVYNTNHSIFNIINLPSIPNYTCNSVFELSDNLFDTDNLLEYCAGYVNSSSSYKYFVISENGTILLDCGVRNFPTVYNIGSNVYKLATSVRYQNGMPSKDSISVYSLPGSKPCEACGGPTSIVKNVDNTTSAENPFPNPTNGQITIPYHFPNDEKNGKVIIYDVTGKVIKEFKVDSAFSNLILDTQEFGSGTYHYNLITNNGISDSKKIIVIK